jgi:two-component system cell cycle sensor histidine kinase/response regulator CckA
VKALEHGDYSYPLATTADGGDEVAQLSRAFQEMRTTLQNNEMQKQELEGQLRQAQKMDAMGRLAGGVAHDFNNLLTIIKGNSSCLSDQLGAESKLVKFTNQIDGAADRAVSLTRQLLAFCRMQVLQPKVLDLNQLVSEMHKLLRRLVREDITFNFYPGESLGRVKADPGQLEQVIMNLVVNAGDAMPKGGTLAVATRNLTIRDGGNPAKPIQPGEYVLLTVTDTGEGMTPEVKARIFEPFYTTKEQGKGTGLGLATVYGIVKQSGGFIWVESERGKGARFEIYLPLVHEEAELSSTNVPKAVRADGAKVILLVEDEKAVRELACEFLKSSGYHVLTAENGEDGLKVAAKHDGNIDLVLTDVVMPEMRGPELVKKLRKKRASLKVIFMTGYLEYNRSNEEFVPGARLIQKPFTRATLLEQIHEELAREEAVLAH